METKKIDRRTLKTKKLIMKAEVNERTNQLFIEFGAGISNYDVYEALAYTIDSLGEHMGVPAEDIWHTLIAIYQKQGLKDVEV